MLRVGVMVLVIQSLSQASPSIHDSILPICPGTFTSPFRHLSPEHQIHPSSHSPQVRLVPSLPDSFLYQVSHHKQHQSNQCQPAEDLEAVAANPTAKEEVSRKGGGWWCQRRRGVWWEGQGVGGSGCAHCTRRVRDNEVEVVL